MTFVGGKADEEKCVEKKENEELSGVRRQGWKRRIRGERERMWRKRKMEVRDEYERNIDVGERKRR